MLAVSEPISTSHEVGTKTPRNESKRKTTPSTPEERARAYEMICDEVRKIPLRSAFSTLDVVTMLSLKKPRCILLEESDRVRSLAQSGLISMGFSDGGKKVVAESVALVSTARLTPFGEANVDQAMDRAGFFDSLRLRSFSRKLHRISEHLFSEIQKSNSNRAEEKKEHKGSE